MANNWWKYMLTAMFAGGAGYLAGWLVTKKIEQKKCDDQVQSVIAEFKGKYKKPKAISKPSALIKTPSPFEGENRDIFTAPKIEDMSAYHKVVRTYEKPEEKKNEDPIHKIISEDEIENLDHEVYYYWPNGTTMDYYNNVIPEQELHDNVGNLHVEYFKTHPEADSVCIRCTDPDGSFEEYEIIKETDMDLFPLDDDEH